MSGFVPRVNIPFDPVMTIGLGRAVRVTNGDCYATNRRSWSWSEGGGLNKGVNTERAGAAFTTALESRKSTGNAMPAAIRLSREIRDLPGE